MTQDQTDQKQATETSPDTPQGKAAEPESTGGEPTPSPAREAKAAPAGRNGLVLLALLLALAAAGGTAFLWWQMQAQQAASAAIGGVRADLLKQASEIERLAERLGRLGDAGERAANDLEALREQLDRQMRQADELPPRIGRLERALENVPGVADQARSAWLLAEAEYYLRVANTELMLAGKADVALRALELADEKLRDLGDPGLTQVRARLADEMTALKALPRPDSEGIVLSLGSLARRIGDLPLAQGAPARFGSETDAPGKASLERAWQAIRTSLLSIIRVKRTDETAQPLVTESDERLLIRGLELELQIARLAIMRNQGETFRNALDNVRRRIEQYFDGDASAVQAAIGTIEDIRATELPEDLPDISGSLSLLLKLSDEAARP